MRQCPGILAQVTPHLYCENRIIVKVYIFLQNIPLCGGDINNGNILRKFSLDFGSLRFLFCFCFFFLIEINSWSKYVQNCHTFIMNIFLFISIVLNIVFFMFMVSKKSNLSLMFWIDLINRMWWRKLYCMGQSLSILLLETQLKFRPLKNLHPIVKTSAP